MGTLRTLGKLTFLEGDPGMKDFFSFVFMRVIIITYCYRSGWDADSVDKQGTVLYMTAEMT